jgi:EmrB/QacA subfamily drug resistance transporter
VRATQHHVLTLPALTLGVVLVTLNVTIVVVALPDIGRDLHAQADTAAWVIDAYNLTGASLLLAAGFLADRIGRRRVLLAGYTIFAVAALGCALAPSIDVLVALRAVQGIGGTALTPTSLAIVANLYAEPGARARAIGIWGIAGGIGTALGPIVGGAFADSLGWRAVFVVNAALAALAIVAVLRVVPPSRADVRRRFDPLGQVTATILLATLTYAIIEAPRFGWGSTRILALLALDVVLLAAFVAIERRAASPLVDLRFFRDRQFAGAVAVTVAIFVAFAGFIYVNTLLLQRSYGLSALATGVAMLPAALPTLVGGPLSGRIVARRGARGVLGSGTAGMAAGLVLLALLDRSAPLGALLVGYAVLGCGYAVVNAPISTVAVATLPRNQAGVAASVASTARNVGLVLGVALLGTVLANGLPARLQGAIADGSDVPGLGADLADAARAAFAVAAAIIAIASAVAFLTLRSEPPGHSPEEA